MLGTGSVELAIDCLSWTRGSPRVVTASVIVCAADELEMLVGSKLQKGRAWWN